MGKEKQSSIIVVGNSRTGFRIKYTGVLDVKKVVNAAKNYLINKKYYLVFKTTTETSIETKYIWIASRFITDYIMFKISVDYWIMNMRNVTFEENGKKKKAQWAKFEMTVKATMAKNYRKKYKSTKMGKFFKQTFEKYVAKEELEDFENKAKREGDELIGAVKEALEMYYRILP